MLIIHSRIILDSVLLTKLSLSLLVDHKLSSKFHKVYKQPTNFELDSMFEQDMLYKSRLLLRTSQRHYCEKEWKS